MYLCAGKGERLMKHYLVCKTPRVELLRTYFTIRASNMEEATITLNLLIDNEKGTHTIEPIGWLSEDIPEADNG